jgi:hypothetical protein
MSNKFDFRDHEAADMLDFLLERFQMHSPKMDGQHSYRFRNNGWPMTHFVGKTVVQALRSAMNEENKYKTKDFC